MESQKRSNEDVGKLAGRTFHSPQRKVRRVDLYPKLQNSNQSTHGIKQEAESTYAPRVKLSVRRTSVISIHSSDDESGSAPRVKPMVRKPSVVSISSSDGFETMSEGGHDEKPKAKATDRSSRATAASYDANAVERPLRQPTPPNEWEPISWPKLPTPLPRPLKATPPSSPTEATGPRERLPFPLCQTIQMTPLQRAVGRGKQPGRTMTARPELTEKPAAGAVGAATQWKANPALLQGGKKPKYYGVRVGRWPGIYYSWVSARPSVEGFSGAVSASFPDAGAVEHFMNHLPNDCRYGACACRPEMAESDASDAECEDEPPACECCGTLVKLEQPLCLACFVHPTAWLDHVAKKHNLIEEQADVVRAVSEGRNVFFTGAAGTGKSRVVHAIQDYLRGLRLGVATIAPTGIAALSISGTTLHTYAGWNANTSRESLKELCERAHLKKIWKRFHDTDVLIIDEISMVESSYFTRLSQMMQAAAFNDDSRGPNHSQTPFGSVQVVVCGDFYQLPPVRPFHCCLYCGAETAGWEPKKPPFVCETHGEFDEDEQFAFCSPVWKACNFHSVQLENVHRQSEDPLFRTILHAARKGQRWSDKQNEIVLNHKHNITDRSEATKLLPTRNEVARVNDFHMSQLSAQSRSFSALDHFAWNREKHPELAPFGEQVEGHPELLRCHEDKHRFADRLELKHGMLVLLLTNLDPDQKLVNGSLGHVVGFVPMENHMPFDRDPDSKGKVGGRGLGERAQYQNDQIWAFRNQIPEPQDQKWPVVRFKNGQTRVIIASCEVRELGKDKPYSLLSRTQIPLIAGWAMTIHKSQGLTLDRVILDLASVFELGQAYVALSRARSLFGLIVQSLPRPQFMSVNPVIEGFMEEVFGEQELNEEIVKGEVVH